MKKKWVIILLCIALLVIAFYIILNVYLSYALDSPAIHADNGLFKFIAHALAFGDQLRLKLAVTIPGNIEHHVTQGLGFYFFGIGAITTVATVVAIFGVLLIAQMAVKFGLQHLFDTLLIEVSKPHY